MNLEHLAIAIDMAEFTLESLRDANKTASAVESIVLLPLIANAAALVTNLKHLRSSIENDEKESP